MGKQSMADQSSRKNQTSFDDRFNANKMVRNFNKSELISPDNQLSEIQISNHSEQYILPQPDNSEPVFTF